MKQNLSVKIVQSKAAIQAQDLPAIPGFESQLEQLFQNLIPLNTLQSGSQRFRQQQICP